MEEDLQNIDLIDKYLNDTLTEKEQAIFEKLARKNPSFRRDLEVYQQMYKGLEATNKNDLKKRLSHYYTSYKEDKKSKERKGKIRRLVLVGASIAATLVLGWFLIYQNSERKNYPLAQPNNYPPDNIENKDSIKNSKLNKTKKTQEQLVEKPLDTISKKLLPDTDDAILAVGGMVPLAKENIKLITYPSKLSYTFNGSQLQIYGDPLIPSLRIKVGRTNDGNYALQIKNSFYLLKNTNTKSVLRTTNQEFSATSIIEDEIEIIIKDIRQEANELSNLKVFIKKEKEPGIFYKFQQQDNKLQLVINGNIDLKSTRIWQLDYQDKTTYYLQLKEKLFKLNHNTAEFQQITPLNLLKSDINKLFGNRAPIKKKLLLWQ
jgi:hypothetical protein